MKFILKSIVARRINLLFYFTFLIFVTCLSQDIIETDIFTVCYSQKLEQPLWLEYEIRCIDGSFSRKGMSFKKNQDYHTSDNLDYKNNVWDKGHLAPAATFNCSKDMLLETFTFLNCALQHNKLNQGPWSSLEEYERQLSKTHNVRGKIDLVFNEQSLVLQTGATVPSFFIKTIYFNRDSLVVRFPNQDVSGINWREFILK